MVSMSAKQRKALEAADLDVETKRVLWQTAYNAEKAVRGVAVRIVAAAALETAWNNLVTARSARNALLQQYRAQGINI